MCGKCGGLVGELGKAYGWTGRWCCCALGPPSLELDVLKRAWEDLQKTQPPATILGASPSLTPADFVYWLRGYAAHGHVDPKILAELQRVKS